MATPAKAVPEPESGRDLEAEAARLTALQQRAMDGDAGALAELRKVFDADPGWWQQTGNAAWQAELAWLRAYAGRDELAIEATSRKMRAMRRDLCGPSPSPLERLLVSRIVLNWLSLAYAEGQYARKMRAPEGLSLDLSTHCQERIDRCQKRYLAAIKALATLRKLERAGPLVAVGVGQVNIADQQVNVATMAPERPPPAPDGATTGPAALRA